MSDKTARRTMHFVKMHGLGNDFVLLGIQPPDAARLARAMCDRHFGVGADGLILVLPSEAHDFAMRIFNPDGSEPEMCGNGIRCAAKYYIENVAEKQLSELRVDTLAGVRTVRVAYENGEAAAFTVDMGAPEFAPGRIPVRAAGGRALDLPVSVNGRELRVNCVSMGNPHAVIFVDEELSDEDFSTLGPALSAHEIFPRQTNVEFARVAGPGDLRVRVWERGAGPTLACGTGACATLAAAHETGRANRAATVRLPGGNLLIEWLPGGSILMSGPATTVFSGRWTS